MFGLSALHIRRHRYPFHPAISWWHIRRHRHPFHLAGISSEAKAVLCTAPQHYPCIITQATLVPPCLVAKAKALGVCLNVYDSGRNAYFDLLIRGN
eukprot:g35531.t1